MVYVSVYIEGMRVVVRNIWRSGFLGFNIFGVVLFLRLVLSRCWGYYRIVCLLENRRRRRKRTRRILFLFGFMRYR